MRVEVYGASDDLVEVEGDLSEEFNWTEASDEEEAAVLAFGEGTILSIRYDEHGFWRIAPVHHGAATVAITQATDADADYSDRAVLEAPDIPWVVFGSEFVRRAP